MSHLQRCTNALYGIECWMRKQGLKTTTKTVSDITAEFLKSKGLEYANFNPRYKGSFTAAVFNALNVQEHFEEFKEFVKKDSRLSSKQTWGSKLEHTPGMKA